MSKKEQEFQLWQDWTTSGDNTKLNQLLESYDPLIQKEVNVFKSAPLPQEAIKLRALALTKKAFETYDPSKSQLNTHVTNSLKKLNRFVYEYQNIGKIPEHRILRITQYKAIKDQLRDQLLREPTTMEIASEMKIPPIEVERLETELRQDLTIRNEKEGEEDGGGGGFFLDPQLRTNLTTEAIHFVYYSMTDPTDQKLMEYYFGLFGNPKLSVLTISQKLNIPYTKANKRLKEIADLVQDTSANLG